jgi:hypothetical protein
MLPSMGDYVAINKAMWDERAPVHAASAHYGFDRFIGDTEHISGVVRFGALCWLPNVARWARVVAELLRPGGRLFIREAHPMLWSLDERSDPPTLHYPYFEHAEPVVFDDPGTYVQTEVVFTHGLSHSWNHGLGEIITALLGNKMRITQLVEHDIVSWEALAGQMVVDDAGEWRLSTAPERLAASYTMQAIKL